jgi:hypothetical protein
MRLRDNAYGSDKVEHDYTMVYEEYLSPLKEQAKNIMEIGVWRGASIRMWRDFFPNAKIWGVDFIDMSIEGDRVEMIKVDQSKREDIEKLKIEMDVIIDDGSHLAHDQQITLAMLFPYIKYYYFIEDLEASHQTEIMLERFIKGDNKIVSEFMTEEEINYLEKHMECQLFKLPKGTLAMLKKV